MRLCALFLLLAGCTGVKNGITTPVQGDPLAFAQQAQPVLQRHCAFEACHGRADLALSLYAVDYVRLATGGPGTPLDERVLSDEELDHNHWALAVRVDSPDPEASRLLRKVRPISDGGEGHFDVTTIFSSRADPDYQALCAWAQTVSAARWPGKSTGCAPAP